MVARGDIVWADLGPPAGRRPVCVLTRDAAIAVLTAITCAPVTRTSRGIRSEVEVGPSSGLPESSVICCDNLITIPTALLDDDPVGHLDFQLEPTSTKSSATPWTSDTDRDPAALVSRRRTTDEARSALRSESVRRRRFSPGKPMDGAGRGRTSGSFSAPGYERHCDGRSPWACGDLRFGSVRRMATHTRRWAVW